MRFELHRMDGGGSASTVAVSPDRPVKVGRNSDSEIKLVEEVVSRRHCTIRQVGDQLWVRDEKSMNGTRLNNKPLIPGKECRLQHGDCLQIGSCLLVVEQVDPEVDTPHFVECLAE